MGNIEVLLFRASMLPIPLGHAKPLKFTVPRHAYLAAAGTLPASTNIMALGLMCVLIAALT
jgi:hypothetical protein